MIDIREYNSYKTIDYETFNDLSFDYGTRPYHKNTHIFSYCIGNNMGDVNVCRLDTQDKRYNRKNWIKLFQFWKDKSIGKIGHNVKFEINLNRANNIPLPEDTSLHCTMIQNQLLRNLAPSHGLAFLNWELNDPQIYSYEHRVFDSKSLDKYVKDEAKKLGGYNKIEKTLMDIYQVADGQRPMLLFMLFDNIIQKNKELYEDYLNEMELIKATQRMEEYGLKIDRESCNELIQWLDNQLDEIENEAYDLLGKFINLKSPDQLSRILYFDHYSFPIYKFTDDKKPSTDKDTLMQLKEDFPNEKIFDYILKHRSYTKGLANIKSYLDFANEFDIIHHNIQTNRAKTGREASSNPNLQNVEKEDALKNPYPVLARSCFIARDEHLMFFVDYSGIEMCLIIEAANCQLMMELMRQGQHPHVIFCKMVFGEHLPQEKRFISKALNHDMYNGGKNAHFALGYGAGLGKIALTVNLTIEEVRPGYDAYRNRFPEIAFLVKKGIAKIRDTGYVVTPFGRTLWIPRDKIYGWLNYYIQGTAAGIIKRAQVRIDKYLRTVWKNSGIRLVLPIHDELVLSYPRKMLKYRDEVLSNISRLMISIEGIDVPLKVEWKKTSTSWNKAKEFIIAY